MVIRQGDIYWVELDDPTGSEPGYSHPHIIVQNNVFNSSRMRTVTLCPLTSNLRRGQAPGNAALNPGQAGLTKPSVVIVSQVLTLDQSQLGDYIGILTKSRVEQILDGLRLLTEPRELE